MNEQNGAKENFRFFGKNAKIPRTKNELVLEDGDGAAPSSILPSVNDHHTEEKAANVSAANNATDKHERANTERSRSHLLQLASMDLRSRVVQTYTFLGGELEPRPSSGHFRKAGLASGNGCIILVRKTPFFASPAAKP